MGRFDTNSAHYDRGVQQAFDDVKSMGLARSRAGFNSTRPIGYRPATLDEYHFDKGYCDGLVKCLWGAVAQSPCTQGQPAGEESALRATA